MKIKTHLWTVLKSFSRTKIKSTEQKTPKKKKKKKHQKKKHTKKQNKQNKKKTHTKTKPTPKTKQQISKETKSSLLLIFTKCKTNKQTKEKQVEKWVGPLMSKSTNWKMT